MFNFFKKKDKPKEILCSCYICGEKAIVPTRTPCWFCDKEGDFIATNPEER